MNETQSALVARIETAVAGGLSVATDEVDMWHQARNAAYRAARRHFGGSPKTPMARAAFFAASEFAGDFFPGVIDRAEEARTGMAGVPWYALKVAQAAEAAWFDQNDLEEVE